jgi:beta-glucosidase-like glycosyl hydrolase
MPNIRDFRSAVEAVKSGNPHTLVAQALMKNLTNDELLSLLDGDSSFWQGLGDLYEGMYHTKPFVHGAVDRLGIPGIRYCDGPRGITIKEATVFPIATSRGATWDVSLEERVGVAIGLEARVHGANTVGSICINLPRHPAWGQVQESYGEDPILLGEFGAAHVRGLQRNVMACIKHFALNSMETARFRVNVCIDDAALNEVYLPHFRRCVEEGAMSVMSAYNAVNGEWAGEHKKLLTDVLRKRWGFEGFVISDWVFGLRDGIKSIKAGLDIEAPFQNLRARSVQGALTSKQLSWAEISTICRRILSTQLRHYASRSIQEPTADIVFNPDHRNLAREVANKAIVLLKNNDINGWPLLPIPLATKRCAVIGHGADSEITGDRVDCPEVISWFQGIRQGFPETNVVLSSTRSVQDAVSAALEADYAIVIVGYDATDEGEFLKPSRQRDAGAFGLYPPFDNSPFAKKIQHSIENQLPLAGNYTQKTDKRDFHDRPTGGDRVSIRLRSEDVELIRAVAAANPRTVVIIRTAGTVIIEEWVRDVPAVMIGWYNGCQGGHAIADVLNGAINPSGRLPWCMPMSEEHLPEFDANANQVTYNKWFGQRMVDRLGVEAAFPLGFGLSYTKFRLHSASANQARGRQLTVSVKVANIGDRSGRCVIQVYGRPRWGDVGHEFPSRVLLGFRVVEVDARTISKIDVSASTIPLQRWHDGRLVTGTDDVSMEIGQYAGDPDAISILSRLATAQI